MPFATDRREKMFTAANLNSLYNRFDQKVYRTLNGVSPLMSNSTSGVWQGLYPYGVWYVYRTDPDTCKRLKDNGDVPSPSIPGIGIYWRNEHSQQAARIELSKLENKYLDVTGGQVYVDGANLNAMTGFARFGDFGGDVSHLNLHKTFCIPHGGGGPGVGPVAAKKHLAPFLPGHFAMQDANHALVEGTTVSTVRHDGAQVSSAPYGSPSILPISWAYIRMMGDDGIREATASAVLAANYVASRLEGHFPVLYTGDNGLVAHECILDIRPLTADTGVTVDDVAKRLVDYGFHAPTMSFPVAGTLMVEPTESEDLVELERFIEAMISIRAEADAVKAGTWPADDNPLANAPHTAASIAGEWNHPYSRETAVYPFAPKLDAVTRSQRVRSKYWPPVRRIDNAFGDRNLVCACPPPEAFES
jgi:glycine dehydrogenase